MDWYDDNIKERCIDSFNKGARPERLKVLRNLPPWLRVKQIDEICKWNSFIVNKVYTCNRPSKNRLSDGKKDVVRENILQAVSDCKGLCQISGISLNILGAEDHHCYPNLEHVDGTGKANYLITARCVNMIKGTLTYDALYKLIGHILFRKKIISAELSEQELINLFS